MTKKIFLGGLLALSMALPAAAEFPKNWYIEGVRDLLNGNLISTAIQADGGLVLSAQLQAITQLQDANIMDAVMLNQQEVLVGTSQQGRALVLNSQSKSVKEVLNLSKGLVTAVASDGKGNLYAASAPDGQIYKGTAQSGLKPLVKVNENYIWDFVSANNKLYFVTGSKGALYELKGDQAELLFQSSESNLRTVYYDAKWGLVVGGGSKGILYHYTGTKTPQALLDTGFDEITAITGNGKGDLYIAANRAQASKNSSKSAVFHLDANGHSEMLFPLEQESAYSLALNSADTLFIGTGNGGRMYTINYPAQPEKRTLSLVARSESNQLSHLLSNGKQILALGSSPARLDLYTGDYRRTGIYETDILSTGLPARWGTLHLEALQPSGTQIKIWSRSGNTRTPDSTWSPWQETAGNAQESQLKSPTGRYLQLKFELSSSVQGTSPRINNFDLSFLRENMAPIVHEVFFLERGLYFTPHTVGKLEGPRSLELTPQILDKLRPIRNTQQIYETLQAERSAPQMRMVQQFKPGMLTLAWDAEDPNNDNLIFDVYYQIYGQSQWHALAKDLSQLIYSFDSSALMDGKYRFRVYAKDNLSNPASTAYKVYRDSELMTLDNTPPVLKNISASQSGNMIELSFSAQDQISALAYAEYALDGQSSQLIQSEDKIIDAQQETFRFRFAKPAKGLHVVVVKVTDRLGNASTGKVSFEVH